MLCAWRGLTSGTLLLAHQPGDPLALHPNAALSTLSLHLSKSSYPDDHQTTLRARKFQYEALHFAALNIGARATISIAADPLKQIASIC